jgi:hypothetical protein
MCNGDKDPCGADLEPLMGWTADRYSHCACNTRRQGPHPLRAPQDGAVWWERTLKRTTPRERSGMTGRQCDISSWQS